MVHRIAIIAPEFPPEKGGMQRYAWEIAIGFAQRGHSVTVFTKKRSLDGLPKSPLNFVATLQGNRRKDQPVIEAHAGQFDVWHVMNAAWSWIAEFVGPVVVSVHGNDFLDPNPVVRWDLRERFKLPWGSRLDYFLAKWLTARTMRASLSKVRHVFANSDFTKSRFLDRFPFCQDKMTTTYVGVSDFFLRARRVAPLCQTSPHLVTVCRLDEPRKNVDMVLLALARLKDSYAFHYSIIGDGILRPSLERLAQDLGLADRVRFVGWCDDETLRNQLTSSDLFILTSSVLTQTIEGFGIVYLEANACGVPVLAAQAGGAAEAVVHGRSGILVESVTVESVESALRKFLDQAMILYPQVCREHAASFAWSTVLDQISAQYKSVLAQDSDVIDTSASLVSACETWTPSRS